MLNSIFTEFWTVFNAVVSAEWFIPIIVAGAVFACACLIRFIFGGK